MAKNRRKEDEGAPTLAERVHMWVSSAHTLYGLIIPLLAGMTVYGTSDTVRDKVEDIFEDDPLPVATGAVITPVNQPTLQAHVKRSLETIVNKLDDHQDAIEKLQTKSKRDDTDLQRQIDENSAKIRYWHE